MTRVKDSVKRVLHWTTKHIFVQSVLRGIARAHLLPHKIWEHVPCQSPLRVSLPGGASFACQPLDADDAIGRTLFWRGWLAYEGETTEIFFELARQANLVVDVGANTGFFSLLACAANDHSRVIAFEPVPHIHTRLVSQVAMNGWMQRCQTRCEAVAEFNGNTKLHVPSGIGIPTSASLDVSGFRGYEGSLIDVPVVTLDSVCEDLCITGVDLVKLDVENHEHRVLQGMQHVLAEFHPAIILECNPDGPFATVESILQPLGYRFYHLCRNGPVLKGSIIPDPTQSFRNYLCLADETPLSLP